MRVITDPFTRADLIKLQQEDLELQPLFKTASDSESEYMVADDILYAINKEPVGEENPYKIVVPQALRSRILELGHSKSGHFGMKKTRKHNPSPLLLARHRKTDQETLQGMQTMHGLQQPQKRCTAPTTHPSSAPAMEEVGNGHCWPFDNHHHWIQVCSHCDRSGYTIPSGGPTTAC